MTVFACFFSDYESVWVTDVVGYLILEFGSKTEGQKKTISKSKKADVKFMLQTLNKMLCPSFVARDFND